MNQAENHSQVQRTRAHNDNDNMNLISCVGILIITTLLIITQYVCIDGNEQITAVDGNEQMR